MLKMASVWKRYVQLNIIVNDKMYHETEQSNEGRNARMLI